MSFPRKVDPLIELRSFPWFFNQNFRKIGEGVAWIQTNRDHYYFLCIDVITISNLHVGG